VGILISVVIVIDILSQRRDAAATLAWIFGVILLPYIGAIFYLFLASKAERRRLKKRGRALSKMEVGRREAEQYLAEHRQPDFSDVTPEFQGVIRLAEELGAGAATVGNKVTFLPDGQTTFDLIEEAIRGACSHVHLEYYIFRPDQTGRSILELLTEKAKEGVKVRLLYDAVGSGSLKSRHLRELHAAGGKTAAFYPLFSLRRPFSANFRTHRKIVIVDDHTGFVGGRNVGDEYRVGKSELGEWQDAHVRVEGPAVYSLQEIFAEDWIFAADEDLTEDDCCFTPFTRPGKARAQILASGPGGRTETIQRTETIHRTLFEAIVSAKKTVDIITPYFVPDEAIEMALQNAALRGVRVRILAPGKTDNILVGWAARSYFNDQLRAGVEVYRFTPGMHHAKLVVIDEIWAYIGTSNMDVRSFRLNFEVGLAVYEPHIAEQIVAYMENDLKRSEALHLDEKFQDPNRVEKLCRGIGRALSPVL
jgi:cardiolipin synthase